MIGVLLSLFSAFSFSMSNILVRRGVVSASASVGAFITVILGVPMFVIGALIFGQLFKFDEISLSGFALLAAAGIIHFVVGRSFNYAAIGAIGASRSAPIQSLNLPYSVVVAFIFLGEGITLGMVFAILLIMVGPALIIERPPSRPNGAAKPAPEATPPPVTSAPISSTTATVTTAPPAAAVAEPAPAAQSTGFTLRQTEGYIFAILAAASYGTSPVLIRAALEGKSDLSVLGGLISYVAAAGLLVCMLVIPSRRSLVRSINPATVRVFFWAGFAVFLAQMFRFLALSEASVALVTTLLRFGSVITLVLSWYMNRSLENINGKVVVGVLVSVAGALLLVATQP